MKKLARIAARVALGGAVLTGAIGVLHMPFAAPLLRKISPSFVCPLQKGTAAQIDRAHQIGAASIRATASEAAPVRPALGFSLDVSRRADLDAWASKNDVSCDAIAGNETLQRCADVPAAAVGEDASLGPLEEAIFEFNQTGALVNVQTTRRHLSTADGARVAASLASRNESALGTPTKKTGDATEAAMGKGPITSFVAEQTFTDYRATVMATKLASTGTMVREQYLSLR